VTKSCPVCGSSIKKTKKYCDKICYGKSMIGNTRSLGFSHTDEAKLKISTAMKGTMHSLGNQNALGHIVSDETRDAISKSNLARVTGCWKSGVHKETGIHFQSSYEAIFIHFCYLNNIEISRSTRTCHYKDLSNGERKYYPDFDTKTKTYEIKGQVVENDRLKWSAFKEKYPDIEFVVLEYDDLVAFVGSTNYGDFVL
jgi:hypothetical protein